MTAYDTRIKLSLTVGGFSRARHRAEPLQPTLGIYPQREYIPSSTSSTYTTSQTRG